MSKRPSVLVDVDGTLVDSNYFHVVAWWRAFQDIGEEVPMSRIHPMIGMGSDQLVHRLIGRESEEASDAHSRHYEPFKDEIKAFPQAAEFLRELARRGLGSSWPRRRTRRTSSGSERPSEPMMPSRRRCPRVKSSTASRPRTSSRRP